MCLENLSGNAKLQVRAWKLFTTLGDGRFGSLCYPGKYEIGRVYSSREGPGFQAFMSKKDADASLSVWNTAGDMDVCAVLLYGAYKGTIRMMDEEADGKPAWCAPHMKILPKSHV